MHLRRALLLMAVILGSVALVQALVPMPRERAGKEAPAAPPPPKPAAAPVRTLELRYPADRTPPRTEVVPGTHVVIEVAASAAGEASITGLGLIQPAQPATPARFDVLAAKPGGYDITFDPATAEPDTVGRLVVLEPG